MLFPGISCTLSFTLFGCELFVEFQKLIKLSLSSYTEANYNKELLHKAKYSRAGGSWVGLGPEAKHCVSSDAEKSTRSDGQIMSNIRESKDSVMCWIIV